jgi:hypothetical protein
MGNPITSMVASGSLLYVDFGDIGVYKYEAGVWSQITPTVATTIVAGF